MATTRSNEHGNTNVGLHSANLAAVDDAFFVVAADDRDVERAADDDAFELAAGATGSWSEDTLEDGDDAERATEVPESDETELEDCAAPLYERELSLRAEVEDPGTAGEEDEGIESAALEGDAGPGTAVEETPTGGGVALLVNDSGVPVPSVDVTDSDAAVALVSARLYQRHCRISASLALDAAQRKH